MLSVRLPSNLEDQLANESARTGISKNVILSHALADYLKLKAITDMPVSDTINEYRQRQHIANTEKAKSTYKLVRQLADSADRNEIWTKNSNNPESISGKPTPGSYGRNVIVGYYVSDDNELFVISRNLENYGHGTDRYYMNVISYDDWIKYMRPVLNLPAQN